MIATKNTKSHERPAETTPTITKDSSPEMLLAVELLQQANVLLKPMLDFHNTGEGMTMDDVRFYWDVRAVRGKDKYFVHLNGSSTLHKVLAPSKLLDAPQRAEQEIMNTVIIPFVGAFQDELQRVAFEELAAKEADQGSIDLMDDDPR